MVKALLHRMASCPGIMNKKMRCYSKFKHVFQDMYREDDKPWRYLNVPGAPQRLINPRKVMRRMSLTASGRVVEKISGDSSHQLAGLLGFDDGNINIYTNGHGDDVVNNHISHHQHHNSQNNKEKERDSNNNRMDPSKDFGYNDGINDDFNRSNLQSPKAGERNSTSMNNPWEPRLSLNTAYANSLISLAKHVNDDRTTTTEPENLTVQESRSPTTATAPATATAPTTVSTAASFAPPLAPQTTGTNSSGESTRKTTIEHLRVLQTRLQKLQNKNNAHIGAADGLEGRETKETSETTSSSFSSSTPPPPPPPDGWSQKRDSISGNLYYYRQNVDGTYDTTWDSPTK